jgi:hypothetical protein
MAVSSDKSHLAPDLLTDIVAVKTVDITGAGLFHIFSCITEMFGHDGNKRLLYPEPETDEKTEQRHKEYSGYPDSPT